MNSQLLECYWSELPTGRKNAVDYPTLCQMWGCNIRTVRSILHKLSSYDNGDDFVLIRSSKSKGFYKTDDRKEIEAYRRECLAKGRSVFAPLKKCNRVLNADIAQMSVFNNLRAVRESLGMTQKEVCEIMQRIDKSFDASILSKMENGVVLPTAFQLVKLAQIYRKEPSELVSMEEYALKLFGAI